MLLWHWPRECVCVCAIFSSRRTHTAAIYSVENFNGLFCILNTPCMGIAYRTSNPIWMIENCIRNNLFMISSVAFVSSIQQSQLYAIRSHKYMCPWAHMHGRYSFLSIFVALQCDRATVNFHATLYIWLERFIIIAHPVKFWINSCTHTPWYILCNMRLKCNTCNAISIWLCHCKNEQWQRYTICVWVDFLCINKLNKHLRGSSSYSLLT